MKTTNLVLLAALAIGGLASCSKDPIAGQDRSIYLVGDSVMASAEWGNGSWDDLAPDGYKTRTEAFGGKTAADHIEQVRTYGSDDVPERLVIELGTNEARSGGWDATEAASYRDLVDAAPSRTCIVVVVPAAAGWANEADRANVSAAAAEIREIASEVPKHRIVEFSTFIDANPDMIAADGIHLVDGDEPGKAADEVRVAYRDWLWPNVNDCVGGRRTT